MQSRFQLAHHFRNLLDRLFRVRSLEFKDFDANHASLRVRGCLRYCCLDPFENPVRSVLSALFELVVVDGRREGFFEEGFDVLSEFENSNQSNSNPA